MRKNMTLTGIARHDKGQVQGEVELTDEGYIKGRAIVTRCGVFMYKNADGTVRKELRHPDDVLVTDSLESMRMIPVVDGHPPERLVSADNAKRLSVGYTGETVDQEMPYILANIVITDKATVEKIKDKSKNELSLGYTVDLIPETGTYYGEPYEYRQTNIRYNHLALVDQARAGPQAKITLDGEDAEEILKQELTMAKEKGKRKVKIDAEEYMLEDDAANSVDKMIAEKDRLLKDKDELEGRIEQLENELDKAHAERDSMRDKDVHNPAMEHQEKDEIGANGKEMNDPTDTGGMQSHVKDYTPPTPMENHAVMSPKNEHYPNDLPHIAKVDSADVAKMVKNRVKLEKLSERYLDRKTLQRMDSMSDLDIKKALITSLQPNAVLDGKSEAYINARFDAACESIPESKVIANPITTRGDEDLDKDRADADEARLRMIKSQKNAWKPVRR